MLGFGMGQGKFQKKDSLLKISKALGGTFRSLTRSPSPRMLGTTVEYLRLLILVLSDVMKPLLTAQRKNWKMTILPLAQVGMHLMMLYLLATDSYPFTKVRTLFTLTAEHLESLENSGGIYALLSIKSRSFYIGRTDNFQRRAQDHYYSAIKGDPQKVYTHVRSTGISQFFLVPLHVVDGALKDCVQTEAVFIKRLSPNLNTQLAKKRKNSRKRALLKFRKKRKPDDHE